MTISSAASLDYGASTNIVTNGGLETNTTGWVAQGTNTIARSTEQARSGAASLKVTYQNAATPMASYVPLVVTDELHAFSWSRARLSHPTIHTNGATASRAATAISLPTTSLNGSRGHIA